MGKDRATTPTADSQRAFASHSVSSESVVLAPHSSPRKQAGGAGVIAPLGTEKGGSPWEAQCGAGSHGGRGGLKQNFLAPPAMLLSLSLSLRALAGQDTEQTRVGLGSQTTLHVGGSAPLSLHASPPPTRWEAAALFLNPGRGGPYIPDPHPTPRLPGAKRAFVRRPLPDNWPARSEPRRWESRSSRSLKG